MSAGAAHQDVVLCDVFDGAVRLGDEVRLDTEGPGPAVVPDDAAASDRVPAGARGSNEASGECQSDGRMEISAVIRR